MGQALSRAPRNRVVRVIRFIGTEQHISRIESAGWGSHTIWEPRRVPTVVREKFSGLTHGRHEVEYDPKTRTANIVPFHERWRI